MIHHNNNGQEYLMVEVPSEAVEFEIENGNQLYFYASFLGLRSIGHLRYLPPGQWQILFLASEATEEQAGEVVEVNKGEPPYQPYYKPYGMSDEEYSYELELAAKKLEEWEQSNTALESLRSLLSSHGMEGETLFLKKIK